VSAQILNDIIVSLPRIIEIAGLYYVINMAGALFFTLCFSTLSTVWV